MAHGDLTGKQKAALEKEKAAEKDAAAKQITLATQAAAKAKTDEVVDLAPKDLTPAKTDGEVQVLDVDTTEKKVEFKVNSDLEMVTIGHGNHYDFEQGKTYKAPQHVYDHLEELGLIWH